MEKIAVVLFVVQVCYAGSLLSLAVSLKDSSQISEKIWKNECGGTIEGLTSWNKGEDFASLGIGHFIWHTANSRQPFQETFPELLKFMEKEGAVLPAWLKTTQTCPWKSRDDFYQNIKSPEMESLRQFLFETKHLQAVFMAKRLEKALPQMVEGLSVKEKERVTIAFYRLADEPRGLYALIDYLNFKGLGISPKESYQGKSWGLRQVLLGISPTTPDIVKAFVESAHQILIERVKNSPPERNEQRWLKGWLNRLNQYL